MNATCRLFGGVFLGMLVASSAAHAQGRGGGAWTTAGADAQRTSSVRADAKNFCREHAEARVPVPLEAQIRQPAERQ